MPNESEQGWRRGGPILGALAALGVAAAIACTGSSREPIAVGEPFAAGRAGDDEAAAVEETPNAPRTESRYGTVGRAQAEPEELVPRRAMRVGEGSFDVASHDALGGSAAAAEHVSSGPDRAVTGTRQGRGGASPAARRHALRELARDRAELGSGGASPAARRRASRLMARNGVLASNFVGGGGVETRLSDLLERGVMIDGANVRIEAFQDRDRLPYAVPREEAVALHTELERTKVYAAGDTVHLQIALLARQGEAPPRPRLDVRLVLDRSGSMNEEGKWQNAVAAAHALVDRLEPGDTFGLISYADEASLDVTPAPHRNRRAIHRTIDRIRPGGGTNIGAALDLASQYRPRRLQPTDVGLVVLLSDGMATVGVTDARTLAAKARGMFDEDGILTTTIGVGTSFDEETMLSVAREGSGSYYFVRRAADVSDVLEDELEDRVQAVAQALRLRVVLGPGVVPRRVYGSRLLNEEEHAAVRATEIATDRRIARELGVARDRQREEEEGLRIHLPTFRRGDQHVVLMELDVPGGRAGSTAGVARVYLDYKDLWKRENGHAERVVTAERVSNRDDAMSSVQRTVKRTVLSFQAGETLQSAANALGAGDAQRAARLLAERRVLLEAVANLWRDPALRRDAALLGRYETVVARAWPSLGHHDRRMLVMAMGYFGDQRMR